MSDPGLTSEQRAAIAVHNATQNRVCLNLSSGNGRICVPCSEVADQIDAAVEVERQRGQAALAAARRECDGLRKAVSGLIAACEFGGGCDGSDPDTCDGCVAVNEAKAALAAPVAGDSK